jgi:hypothetical protein
VVHQQGDRRDLAAVSLDGFIAADGSLGERPGDGVRGPVKFLEGRLPGGARDGGGARLPMNLFREAAWDGLLGVRERPGRRGRSLRDGPGAQRYTTCGRV